MTLWNAAKAASNRPLRKPIKFGNPVGDNEFNVKAGDDRVCECGYSVCNCPYEVPSKIGDKLSYGESISGLPIVYHAELDHGVCGWVNGHGIMCGLLKKTDVVKAKAFIPPQFARPREIRRIT